MTATWAVMQLADGRLPAGGHAHSAGLERAVVEGDVDDLAGVVSFVDGRLRTAGTTDAALAVAARRASDVATLHRLDAEAAARTATPALRDASRRQGRALLRVGRTTWPAPLLDSLANELGRPGPMLPIAHGAVGRAAGLDDHAVAATSLYATVTTPATAAVRLLGLDPSAVQRLIATLAGSVDALAAEAADAADRPSGELPAPASVLIDLRAHRHATQEGRLFAS